MHQKVNSSGLCSCPGTSSLSNGACTCVAPLLVYDGGCYCPPDKTTVDSNGDPFCGCGSGSQDNGNGIC